jgi:hypothetical protein
MYNCTLVQYKFTKHMQEFRRNISVKFHQNRKKSVEIFGQRNEFTNRKTKCKIVEFLELSSFVQYHMHLIKHYSVSFQTLNTISSEKNSTIVFPLPIDMFTYFAKK